MEAHSSGAPPPPLLTEFPPLPSLSPQLSTTQATIPSSPPPKSSTQPTITGKQSQISPGKFSLWSELFARSSTPRITFPAPSLSADGIPVVRAPPSILLKASEAWKDHIVCSFFGVPPSHRKIFSDLNPIWGKKGDILIRNHSPRACLIFIPHVQTREWVLNVGFWSAGTVAFSTMMWSPTSTLANQTLSSAPVWLHLHGVPPQLLSEEGVSLIASGIGEPLPSTGPSPSSGSGTPRVRTIVPLLKGPLPSSVIVEDEEGNQAKIGISYPNFPPLCPSCSAYGHRAHRCPLGPQAPVASSSPDRLDPSQPQQPIISSRPLASSPQKSKSLPPATQAPSGVAVPGHNLLRADSATSPPSPLSSARAHLPGPSPTPHIVPVQDPIRGIVEQGPQSAALRSKDHSRSVEDQAHHRSVEDQGPQPVSIQLPGPRPTFSQLPEINSGPPAPRGPSVSAPATLHRTTATSSPAPLLSVGSPVTVPLPPTTVATSILQYSPAPILSKPTEITMNSSVTSSQGRIDRSPHSTTPRTPLPGSGSPKSPTTQPFLSHLDLLRQVDPSTTATELQVPVGLAAIHIRGAEATQPSPLRRTNSSPVISPLQQIAAVQTPTTETVSTSDKSPTTPDTDDAEDRLLSPTDISDPSSRAQSDLPTDTSLSHGSTSSIKPKKKSKNKNKPKQKKEPKPHHHSHFFPLTKRLL